MQAAPVGHEVLGVSVYLLTDGSPEPRSFWPE